MNNLSEQHVHAVRVGSLYLATEMFNDESFGFSNNFGLRGSTRCVEFAESLRLLIRGVLSYSLVLRGPLHFSRAVV